jgi:hypothetical protein
MGKGMGRAKLRKLLWHFRFGAFMAAVFAAAIGCQKTDTILDPSESVSTTVLHATFRSDSTMRHDSRTQIVLDGQALQEEWGSGDFLNILVTPEHGNGGTGNPSYVAMKAVYTETDVFFLIRWRDTTLNADKDVLSYVGPDLSTTPPDSASCFPAVLMNRANWVRHEDEDRVAVAFEIQDPNDTSDPMSHGYASRGCQLACHQGEQPAFGRIESGRLDVWQWLASRTNPVRDLYDRQTEDPSSPRFGIMGYLDDLFGDEVGGLQGDPGIPSYRPNFVEGSSIPQYVYRERDDPFAKPQDANLRNAWGEKVRKNNGVSLLYIWREYPYISYFPFDGCDIMNQVPVPLGTPQRPWRYVERDVVDWITRADRVPGWLLNYPTGSRSDIHGKALSEDQVYSLEFGRALNTGDLVHDVIFKPETGRKYVFTVAVMDNSGTIHKGSQPQILVFDPKGGAR